MKYRAEIDGLRAVAVIPIVLFHAGVESVSGGFVGVDIFFVISGYLITTIILAEMELGTFSLATFYERRARRLLPALFLVMLVSLPFTWLWLMPAELKDFSQSLIAVSTFTSNILFWQETGYWGVVNELKPLLHTWSLAVEEQFYIIFPLFLMAMWKLPRRWLFVSLVLIVVSSFFLSQWGASNAPVQNFFLLPTRAWELAIGATLAFLFLYHRRTVRILLSYKLINEFLSFMGLLMIIYAIFLFDERLPFPGVYALVPTIGTALIILFTSRGTAVGKLLGSRPLVGVGLISYSAYLWHLPLLVFARHRLIDEQHEVLFIVLAMLSFPVAYLSWKFVEKPFRNKNRVSRQSVIRFSIAGSLLFITVGVVGNATDGFYDQYSDKHYLNSFLTYDRKSIYREDECFLGPDQTHEDFNDECFSKNDPAKSIVLWGDSHAGALSFGLRNNSDHLTQLTASLCAPVLEHNPVNRPNCLGINNFILEQIGKLKPKVIILHANWEKTNSTFLGDLYEELASTIVAIKLRTPETRVMVIGGVPQWAPTLPTLLVNSKLSLKDKAYIVSRDHNKIKAVDDILQQVSRENGASFLSLLDIFCKFGKCLSSVKYGNEMEPFAWDYGHLTKASSSLISEIVLIHIKDSKDDLKYKNTESR